MNCFCFVRGRHYKLCSATLPSSRPDVPSSSAHNLVRRKQPHDNGSSGETLWCLGSGFSTGSYSLAWLQVCRQQKCWGAGGTCSVSNTVAAHVPRRKAFSLSCKSIQQLQGLQGKSWRRASAKPFISKYIYYYTALYITWQLNKINKSVVQFLTILFNQKKFSPIIHFLKCSTLNSACVFFCCGRHCSLLHVCSARRKIMEMIKSKLTFKKLQILHWKVSNATMFPKDANASPLQEKHPCKKSSGFFLNAFCPAGPQGANQMADWVSTVRLEYTKLLATLPPLFKFRTGNKQDAQERSSSTQSAQRRTGAFSMGATADAISTELTDECCSLLACYLLREFFTGASNTAPLQNRAFGTTSAQRWTFQRGRVLVWRMKLQNWGVHNCSVDM